MPALARCPRCGYDLTHSAGGRCPECGLDVTAPAVVAGTVLSWELADGPGGRRLAGFVATVGRVLRARRLAGAVVREPAGAVGFRRWVGVACLPLAVGFVLAAGPLARAAAERFAWYGLGRQPVTGLAGDALAFWAAGVWPRVGVPVYVAWWVVMMLGVPATAAGFLARRSVGDVVRATTLGRYGSAALLPALAWLAAGAAAVWASGLGGTGDKFTEAEATVRLGQIVMAGVAAVAWLLYVGLAGRAVTQAVGRGGVVAVALLATAATLAALVVAPVLVGVWRLLL